MDIEDSIMIHTVDSLQHESCDLAQTEGLETCIETSIEAAASSSFYFNEGNKNLYYKINQSNVGAETSLRNLSVPRQHIEDSHCRSSVYLSPLDDSASIRELCCVGEFIMNSSDGDESDDKDESNDDFDGECSFNPDESIEIVRQKRTEKMILMKSILIHAKDNLVQLAKKWAERREETALNSQKARAAHSWLQLKQANSSGSELKKMERNIKEMLLKEKKEIFQKLTGLYCDFTKVDKFSIDAATDDDDDDNAVTRLSIDSRCKKRKTGLEDSRVSFGGGGQCGTVFIVGAAGKEEQENRRAKNCDQIESSSVCCS